MAIFMLKDGLRLIGGRQVPGRCSLSLYWHDGARNGEATYRLLHRDASDDYLAARGLKTAARQWAFSKANLASASNERLPRIYSDLQETGSIPHGQRRSHDRLYRGDMFVRSNWCGGRRPLVIDPVCEQPPAYILIFTSSDVDAFESCRGDSIGNLYVSALRDYLDILLYTAHGGQRLL